MYTINYNPSFESIRTSSKIVECKSFYKMLHQSPGDRHSYSLKYYAEPIRYDLHMITKICFMFL